MNEHELIEKLLRIMALHDRATTAGEKAAARSAADRIQARLFEQRLKDPPVEYRFTLENMYSRRLFCALARHYGLNPYRYHRQRYTTVMLMVPQSFVDETLWPEYQALSAALDRYLDDVTDRVIREAVHKDTREAEETPARAEITGPKR